MDISGQLKDPTALTPGQVPSIAIVYMLCGLWGEVIRLYRFFRPYAISNKYQTVPRKLRYF